MVNQIDDIMVAVESGIDERVLNRFEAPVIISSRAVPFSAAEIDAFEQAGQFDDPDLDLGPDAA